MPNSYGRQVVLPLTNKSGGGVIAGDVVIVDTGNNAAFTTTTTGQFGQSLGVAQETIANNATGRVLVHGYAALINVPASVTRGHFIETHTVAKQATGNSTRRAGSFGQFLTGGTTPTGWLWGFPDNNGATGFADPMTTRGDIIVRNSSNVTARLATGAAGTVFVGGTDPAWETRTVQTYSPAWTGASSNPVLNDGTLTGHYQKIADKLYWINISLLMGASTTYGSGRWIFSLPVTVKSTSPSHQLLTAEFNDSGTAAYSGTARVAAGATVTDVVVSADATGTFQVAASVPFTWTNGDRLFITGVIATD